MLGTIHFQSSDESDVFLVCHLLARSGEPDDETLLGIASLDFDQQPWITGKVPEPLPVLIDGDTSMINGWIRGQSFTLPYTIKIIVEYDEVETVESLPPQVNSKEKDSSLCQMNDRCYLPEENHIGDVCSDSS
ncbi:MAG: hypothetical protein MUF42_12165 [Cytophagaceae bacterium]|jgi:hypothetical protein|nr:hypothetical protein [Cytophagaceae bacterium]